MSDVPMRAGKRVFVPPDEGASISLGGLGVIHKLSGQDTSGSFSIVEHPCSRALSGLLRMCT